MAPAYGKRHHTGRIRPHQPPVRQETPVTRHGDKWKSKITHRSKESFLGYFDDEIEAALAWDAKAKEPRGEYACPNFPEGLPPPQPKAGK